MYTPEFMTLEERNEIIGDRRNIHFELEPKEDINFPEKIDKNTWRKGSYTLNGHKKGHYFYIGFYRIGAIKIHESKLKIV